MKRSSLRLFACLMLLSGIADAQQALVRIYGQPGMEVGQAFLTHYAGRCYAILPTHVVAEAGIPAIVREGEAQLLGESIRTHDLGDDLSLAELSGAVTSDCGFSAATLSRSVTERLNASGLATIRSVNGDGTVAQIPVAVLDDDGQLFLRVQPTSELNQIRKGNSGSMLMASGVPVGILLSVDARFGVGKVMRLDQVLKRFDTLVAGGQGHAQAETTNVADLRINAWSAMAVDADHRAINLVSADGAAPWTASVGRWPVVLEFGFGGEKRAVSGVVLEAGGVEDTALLPAGIEIFISVTEDEPRWRSVTGGPVVFKDGSATFAFAPLWARDVRLNLTGSAGGEDRISIGRVRMLNE